MKRLFLFVIMTTTFFITGCVYSHRSPYGYSSYQTITPIYPRYQEQRYYTPAPPRYIIQPVPQFRSYGHEHHEHRGHNNHSHHRW
jgi:hypothetical protein